MDAVGWITWFLHGILQSILLWAPLIEPLVESALPHPWWQPCEIHDLWVYLLDADGRPTSEFMDLYWECLWSKFRGGLIEQYWTVIRSQMEMVWQKIGELGEEYSSISEWLWDIVFTIGRTLPDWAFDVASGLTRLWELIPEPIRDGLLTWAEFLAGVPEGIQEWIEEHFAWLTEWVNELWDWYESIGYTLTVWWEWAQGLLSEIVEDAYAWLGRTLGAAWAFLVWFWSDPAGALAGWLSPWWNPLVTFATDCLDFWYNLWGEFAEDLAEFLADPLDFLWDRGESWLNRKLEQP